MGDKGPEPARLLRAPRPSVSVRVSRLLALMFSGSQRGGAEHAFCWVWVAVSGTSVLPHPLLTPDGHLATPSHYDHERGRPGGGWRLVWGF